MDGLVRQPFLQIDEIGEKRGAPAIGAKILGEPSRRGVALAHNLLPAVGMNRLTARRVHRQAAQKIKAIEKAVEIGGARRIRPSAEPANRVWRIAESNANSASSAANCAGVRPFNIA
jgi:hypothetical protein